MMFRNWLSGDMGIPGNYAYGPMHLWTAAIVVLATLAVAFFGCANRNHPRRNRALLIAISAFQLAFEIGWRLIYIFLKNTPAAQLWPTFSPTRRTGSAAWSCGIFLRACRNWTGG